MKAIKRSNAGLLKQMRWCLRNNSIFFWPKLNIVRSVQKLLVNWKGKLLVNVVNIVQILQANIAKEVSKYFR